MLVLEQGLGNDEFLLGFLVRSEHNLLLHCCLCQPKQDPQTQ